MERRKAGTNSTAAPRLGFLSQTRSRGRRMGRGYAWGGHRAPSRARPEAEIVETTVDAQGPALFEADLPTPLGALPVANGLLFPLFVCVCVFLYLSFNAMNPFLGGGGCDPVRGGGGWGAIPCAVSARSPLPPTTPFPHRRTTFFLKQGPFRLSRGAEEGRKARALSTRAP